MLMIRTLSIALPLLLACSSNGNNTKTPQTKTSETKTPETKTPEAKTPTEAGTSTFRVYPGSKQFCDGHVSSRTGHISWIAYASADTQTHVAEHYVKKLGKVNHEHKDGEDTWRFPADKPIWVMSVQHASPKGPWSKCKMPPTRTIIMVSNMAR